MGLLPVEKSTLDSVDIELRSFIENSEKHFVYIALGTYFAFSEKYFEEIETMLEKQIHFNVLWSHSRWTPELDQKMDQRKFFIRKMLPQKEILDSGKVLVNKWLISVSLFFVSFQHILTERNKVYWKPAYTYFLSC